MRTNGDVQATSESTMQPRSHPIRIVISAGIDYQASVEFVSAEFRNMDIRLGTVIMSVRLVTVMRRAVTDTHIAPLAVVLPGQNP